ncbi:MAG: ThuA domain-containing protein, partial [Armatimonadota bacterium]
DDLAKEHCFGIDYILNTDSIDAALLGRYELFLQLDYPPYGWKDAAVIAFEKAIEQGTIGWIGLHHASLLGEFDGYPLWEWFSRFLGDITYSDYIAAFAQGTVIVEDTSHPCVRGVPGTFLVEKEEWYIYNRSPRPNVHVIARVDETTYVSDSPVRMGDHPVIWTNPSAAARNLYIFMGHSPALFDSAAYTTLLRNSVLWAAGQN